MAFYKLVAVLMLLHNAPGLVVAQVKSFIIGGHNVVRGDWPWMVYLSVSADRLNKFQCGGTLLNHEWVLTSASCLDRNPVPTIRRSMAWLGTHDLEDKSAAYVGITTFMPHPNYQHWSGGYKHDIALVKLRTKVYFTKEVKPVKLPCSTDTFGPLSECFITGWGNVGRVVPLPSPQTLQELQVSVVPQRECETRYPGLTEDMLCAASRGGDACIGDYGGPLMCPGIQGFVQAGIISFGSCGIRDRPSVYTRVSKYLHFINTYINQEGARGFLAGATYTAGTTNSPEYTNNKLPSDGAAGHNMTTTTPTTTTWWSIVTGSTGKTSGTSEETQPGGHGTTASTTTTRGSSATGSTGKTSGTSEETQIGVSGWLRHLVVVLVVVILICVLVDFMIWRRAKGKKKLQEENTMQVTDSEDDAAPSGGAVAESTL